MMGLGSRSADTVDAAGQRIEHGGSFGLPWSRIAAVALVAAALCCWPGWVTPASAFDCGYTPCGGTGGNAAGYKNTITAQSVSSAGGTVTGASNGATITVTVKRGTFPAGGEVVIGTGVPAAIASGGSKVVVDFSVFVIDAGSGKNLGPFRPLISVFISSPAIETGDSVVLITDPGKRTTLPGAASTGQTAVSLTTNANIAVVKSAPLTPPSSRLTIATKKLVISSGKTNIALRCKGGTRCTGTVSLSHGKGKKAVALGSRRFSIKPGALAREKFTLSSTGKELLDAASTGSPVQVKITAKTKGATASRTVKAI